MDEKPKTYRFRLRTPDETRYEYIIKPFTDGVKAVIGIPLSDVLIFWSNYINDRKEVVLWSKTIKT